MGNLFNVPFAYRDNEKLASAGPHPVAQALISGDANTLQSMMSDEDLAFFKLSASTMEKMASGVPFSPREVDALPDSTVAALTLLGKEAMFKVAAYLEFYQEVARNEAAGRDMARSLWAHQKTARVKEAQAVEDVADNPEFIAALAKHASAELKRRHAKR